MIYNTKYGPIKISSRLKSEFERISFLTLRPSYIEEAMESLGAGKSMPSQANIENALMALGEKEQDKIREMEQINNSTGITIDMGASKTCLGVDT